MLASLIHSDKLEYPTSEDYFSPDEAFPEYPFKHISKKPNNVYRAVRKCLMQVGLDRDNVGSPLWNPFRYIIQEGSKVFVLCNFVYHRRGSESQAEFFAKCTHGSVLRALLDYVLLAAGKQGQVFFGNASLQSCNWSKVLNDTGAAKVLEFYSNYNDKKTKLDGVDLRLHIAYRDRIGRISSSSCRDDSDSSVKIDMKEDSLLDVFYAFRQEPKFRVSDYDPERIESHHAKGKHIYVLNKTILDSDVIISVPKLKTHEKVCITGGLKGCVGAIGHKDCLAHHRFGPPSMGGDEYPQENLLLKWRSQFHDFANQSKIGFFGNFLRVVDKTTRELSRVVGYNQNGNWHGNDTAWRMALDIARILEYADCSGKMQEQKQRRHLVFSDGIIGGQGNGPLSPAPIHRGFLGFCDDVAVADFINCLVMGYDPKRVPLVNEAFSSMRYSLTQCLPRHLSVVFNNTIVPLATIPSHFEQRFIPPDGWANRMELTVPA